MQNRIISRADLNMLNDIKGVRKTDLMEAESLKAFHRLEKTTEVKFERLETKIDDSVNGRLKDNERRI